VPTASGFWDRVGRGTQLFAGLGLFGVSLALMVRAGLGLGPWDVLHQGIADRVGLAIGWVVIAVGAVALIAWIPLRQRPGFGTLANVVCVGLATNAALALLPAQHALPSQVSCLGLGVLLNGVATAMYIGAGFGPGPRDGLMTGLAHHGLSLRVARTGIETSVLGVGFVLGGRVGVGTVVYAACIGALTQMLLPAWTRNAGRPTCGRTRRAAPCTT
jgi:uncharacterized membrane protein YczE